MKRADDLLVAPGFLAALGVLLLNDFVLKPAFSNALTGKLSDFAGLFAFALFWMAVFPRRRAAVCVATGAAFVLWKSAAAQPLIDAWNAWFPLAVSRTVDASDLVALVAVAAAYRYAGAGRGRRAVSPARWALVPLSLFAFAATSRVSSFTYDKKYVFPMSKRALIVGIDSLRMGPHSGNTTGLDTFELWVPGEKCDEGSTATVTIRELAGVTEVGLSGIRDRCFGQQGGSAPLLQLFERCFVARLGGTAVPTAARPTGPTPRARTSAACRDRPLPTERGVTTARRT